MKLAKKLGALTLASAMVVTSVPVVFDNEVQIVKSPRMTVTEAAINTYAATGETVAVINARKATQVAIDAVKELDEIDYTVRTWKAVKEAEEAAKAEVAKVKGDVADNDTYAVDATYITDLRAKEDAIYVAVDGLDAIQPLVDAIAKAEKADSSNYAEGALAEAIQNAKDQLEIFKGISLTEDNGQTTVAKAVETLNTVLENPTALNAQIDLAIEAANTKLARSARPAPPSETKRGFFAPERIHHDMGGKERRQLFALKAKKKNEDRKILLIR